MSLVIDHATVARILADFPVERLRLFGSALTSEFDPDSSDVDLLVEFSSDVEDPFEAYFELKDAMEELFGRPVDLVMAAGIRNPHFSAVLEEEAEEIYAR